jgi:hypothetical protein
VDIGNSTLAKPTNQNVRIGAPPWLALYVALERGKFFTLLKVTTLAFCQLNLQQWVDGALLIMRFSWVMSYRSWSAIVYTFPSPIVVQLNEQF